MSNFNFQILFISIIFIAVSLTACKVATSQVSETQFSIYKKAYNTILNNKELMKGTANSQMPKVSREIISFGNYAQFFEDELLNSSNFSVQEMLFDSLIVGVNYKLENIGSSRGTKAVLFFSNLKKGFFFAEFFSDFPGNRFRFEERPNFGESRVFLFEVNGKDLLLIDSKALAYN